MTASTTGQRLTRSAEHSARALEAARSGLALAVAELAEDPGWHQELDVELPSAGRARLSFTSEELAISTSNALGSETLETEAGRLLPPATVHLVCTGTSGLRRAIYEAIVSVPTVLLDSTFDLGTEGWTSAFNLPVALAGMLVLDAGPGVILAGSEEWTDYRAEFVAVLSQGTGIGFLVRATGPHQSPTGYRLRYVLLGNSLVLEKLVDGTVQETMASAPAPPGYLAGLSHTYTIVVRDDQLTVEVDGQAVLETRDEEEPLLTGRVGVAPLLDTIALVDRVTVTSLLEVRTQWVR